MKLRLTSLAVGAVLGTLGLTAQAADFDANDGDYTIYLSGATASAQFLRNSMIDNVCDPAGGLSGNNITVYQVDADDWVAICDLKPAIGASTVRAIKQGGGSGDGTTPISQPGSSPILYPIPPSPFNAAVCAAPVAAQTGTGTSFTLYDNCNFGPKQLVNGGDIGTSDVEPALFFDVNTPSTGISFTPADNALIDVKALAGLGFGVPATLGLRNALQALQFPTSSSCHPSNADWSLHLGSGGVSTPRTIDVDGDGVDETTVSVASIATGTKNPTADISPSVNVATVADSEACMPNLTRAEVAAMVTGRINKWTQLQRGTTTLVAAASAAGLPVPTSSGVPALNNQRVAFCRRNAGSGTMAQFQTFFLRRPCAKLGDTIVSETALNPGSTTCSYTGNTLTCSVGGSSDMDRCLDDLQIVTNQTGLFPGGNPTNAPRYMWGIGLQSTEKNMNLARGYRFVKVDGVAPTVDNVWAADYFDHFESTCQMRKDNSAIDGAAPGTELRNIFDNICVAGPADVFDTDQNFLHAWGVGGWLSVPLAATGGLIPDAPKTAAALMDPNNPVPVSSWTYRGQSCSAPVVFDPVNSSMENDL